MMRRFLILLAAAALAGIAPAQNADIAPFLEIRPTVIANSEVTTFEWFDQRYQSSLVGLRGVLPNGMRVRFAQRLARLPGAVDRELIDEAFIERRGEWRIGRQRMPFGQRRVVNESLWGGRYDTRLAFGVNASVYAFDEGRGRATGAGIRIGEEVGLSLMGGSQLGMQPSSQPFIERDPSEVQLGAGHDLILGGDVSFRYGGMQGTAEHVLFLNPSAGQRSYALTDVSLRAGPPVSQWGITMGFHRRWDQRNAIFTLEIDAPAESGIIYRVYTRLEGGLALQGGFGMTIRF